MMKLSKQNGITLVVLVITIIILLILAGITISNLTKDGILGKAKLATDASNMQEAIELMNLKITEFELIHYSDYQDAPNLKELTTYLKEDKEIESVRENNEILSDESEEESLISIFVKLKKYKYEFEIDNLLKIVKLDGKEIGGDTFIDTGYENSQGDFEIIIPYIGTTQMTIRVNEDTISEDINKYIYIYNEKVKEETNVEIEVDDLQEDSYVNITVIAITKENKHLIAKKIVKTEPRTYLYNNGDECGEITGGWKSLNIGDNNGSAHTFPTIKKNDDGSMNIYMTQHYQSSQMVGGSVGINNKIDYSKYKKICIKITAQLPYYKGCNVIDLFCNYDNPRFLKYICYSNPLNKQLLKIDISEVKNEDLFIYLQSDVYQGATSCDIYEVWLEK